MIGRTYSDAVTDQRIAARAGRPYPRRITTALDLPVGPDGTRLPPLEGPDVDLACDAAEPAVDRWETGEEVPTSRQLELLAALTGYPVGFFFHEPGPELDGGFMCVRSGCGERLLPPRR